MSCILETQSSGAFFSDSLQVLADFIPSEKNRNLPQRNLSLLAGVKPSVLYRQSQGSREQIEISYTFPLLQL